MRRTMTKQQLEQIAALRRENYPYSFIGRELGLSPNTVKSICQRKGFAASGARKTKAEKQNARSAAIAINHCRKQSGGERYSAQTIAAPNGTEKTGKLRRSGLDFSGQESDEW